jgi:hypothetical protein
MPEVVLNVVFEPIPRDKLATEPLDPTLPVRTRDGRLAWLTEIDATKTLWPVKGYAHDPLGSGRAVANLWMRTGTFLNNKKNAPCDMDLFNISLQEWMAGFDKLTEKIVYVK